MAAKLTIAQQAANYMRMGMREAAEELLVAGARKQPRNAEIAHLLGMLLMQSKRIDEGVRELERAVKIDPRSAELHITFANALATARRFEEAAAKFRRALQLQPGLGAAHLGLALVLPRLHDVIGAIEAGREALRLMPTLFQPYVNLGSALKQAGRSAEAIPLFREACQRFPENADLVSQMLAASNYTTVISPPEVMELARRYGSLVGPAEPRRWPQKRDPDKRLRIGYLSADLRTHSVAYFLEPILASHTSAEFEVFCFSDSPQVDATTQRLRSLVPQWRDVSSLGARPFVEQIQADEIDILVELSGHTVGHRLAAIANRAAPVQATYLGYPGTTGVGAIDYRLVDAETDPPGSEAGATETLERIPECFLCYRPPADAPPVQPNPCESAGYVSFGSFNSMPKTTPAVLETWAALLARVPNSRLVLKNRSLGDRRLIDSLVPVFEAHGVAPDRIHCLPSTPTPTEHLAQYHRVDIAIDTFPYTGTTTTCEALWMGVPVVTCTGNTHASRVSASLLKCLELPELVAVSVDSYIAIAESLANDRDRLRTLRGTMRERMTSSALCRESDFTRRLESVYRRWWRNWCERA